MTYFYENSTMVLAVGFGLFVAAGFVFLKSGRKLALLVAFLIALITGLLVYLESAVVTEREEIQNTLNQIEVDLENNDHAKLVDHFSKDATALRAAAKSIVGRYVIEKVSIKSNLKIEIIKEGTQAQARFNAVGKLRAGSKSQIVPRYFSVQFVKEGNRWKVRDYEHFDPREGMKKAK